MILCHLNEEILAAWGTHPKTATEGSTQKYATVTSDH